MVRTIDYQKIYSDSYWRATNCKINGKDFFDRFYEHFLASSPDVKEKFKDTNFSVQKNMLVDSLIYVNNFSANKRADDFIQKLAKKHSSSDLDVKPHLYDLWLSSLIDTVKEFDPEYYHETDLAWRLMLDPGIEYMKFNHKK